MQTLPEWLVWLVFNGGAGVVAYGAIALLEKWPAFAKVWGQVSGEMRRYISFAVSGGLGVLAFWAQVELGYVEAPGALREWLEAAFPIVVSQIIHARIALSKR
jgi:hypothetical protein